MDDEKPKYCVDCKHHKEEVEEGYCVHQCGAPQNIITEPISIVTGISPPNKQFWSCQAARGKYESYDACGPDAKWFEPKEPQA